MKIYDYPKKGTIPLGVHMMQTRDFLMKASQMTLDMIPDLVKIQKIRRERMSQRLAEPIIKGEGSEDEQELNDETVHTEQGI